MDLPLYPKGKPTKREIEAAARFEIKPSVIPRAGLGAFAKEPIGAGEYLGQYRGEVLTKAQYDAKYPGDHKAYYVMEIAGKFVDAVDPAKSSWTRYVNASDNPFHPLIENCLFAPGGKLHASRPIDEGAELYTPYGPEYRV